MEKAIVKGVVRVSGRVVRLLFEGHSTPFMVPKHLHPQTEHLRIGDTVRIKYSHTLGDYNSYTLLKLKKGLLKINWGYLVLNNFKIAINYITYGKLH